MPSFNNPKVTNPINSDVSEIRELLKIVAKQDYTGATDLPEGAKRLAAVSGGVQLQNFSNNSWSSIGKLMHDVDQLDGYHASTTATKGTIPVYNASAQLVGNITGNAATATKLASKRTIDIGGIATADAVGFDGSGNITIPINSINVANDDDNALVGIVSKAHGGTGRNDGAAADVILANGGKASEYGQIGDTVGINGRDLDSIINSGFYIGTEGTIENHFPRTTNVNYLLNVKRLNTVIRQILIMRSVEIWIRTSTNSGSSWGPWCSVGYTSNDNIVIYISKSGSDSNTGLDSAYPVLTIDRALELAKQLYNGRSNKIVTFCVGEGDWGSITLNSLPYYLQITSYSGDNATEYSSSLPHFSKILAENTLVNIGSVVCDFIDSTANSTILVSQKYNRIGTLRARHGGVIEIDGGASAVPIDIISRTNHDYVYSTYNFGYICHLGARTVNIVENLTLSGGFILANTHSNLSMNGAVINVQEGVTVTGAKYRISDASSVSGVSLDSLPGTVNGSKDVGAIIDGLPYGGGAADEALMADLSWKPVLLQTGGTLTGSVIHRSSTLDDSKVPSAIISYNPIAITDKNGWYAAGIAAYNETSGNKTLQFSRAENNGSDSCFINLSINNGFKSIYTNAQALTLGGNPPDSANGTEAITAAWANKNIGNKINEVNASLANYLPRNGTYALNMPSGEFGVGLGTAWDNSSSLTLYGTDRGADGTSGWFALRARLSSSKGRDLVGTPSGELTWGGAHIVRHINGVYADAGGGVDVINKVKVNNAGYADSAGYANSAGSASTSYICTGVGVWNRVTSATLPNYGTWAWLSIGGRGGDKAGTSAGGTRIYYDHTNENIACIIAIRIG